MDGGTADGVRGSQRWRPGFVPLGPCWKGCVSFCAEYQWVEGQGRENINYPKESFLEAKDGLDSVATCSVSALSEM